MGLLQDGYKSMQRLVGPVLSLAIFNVLFTTSVIDLKNLLSHVEMLQSPGQVFWYLNYDSFLN